MNTDERYSKIYEDEIDLSKYLQVIWKRRVSILFGTLLFAIFAGLISFLLPKSYQSEIFLKVGTLGVIGSNESEYRSKETQYRFKEIVYRNIEDVIVVTELIKSKPFINTAINRDLNKGKMPITLKELNVKATSKKNTRLIQIQAEGRSPEKAVDIVNAIANEIVLRHKEKVDNTMAIFRKMEEDLNAQMEASEKQIEELKKFVSRVQESLKLDAPAVILLRANMNDKEIMLTSLRQRIMDLDLAKSALRTEYTVVTDPPLMPEQPVKPIKAINIAMGTVIGLIISILGAFGAESLDSWKSKQKET